MGVNSACNDPPAGARLQPWNPLSAPRRAVLVLGNYRPTLTVVRTLARSGFHVVLGLGHDREGSAQYSRYAHEIWDHPRLDGADAPAFRAALRDILAARPEIGIVYPVTEAMARWMADHEGDLPAGVLIASPPAAVVKTCLDKLQMAERATLEGVPCQPFAAARSLQELCAEADRLGYPVVVRPLDHLLRLGNKKALIIDGRDDLSRALPVWPEGHRSLLLQRFARGERRNVYFAAESGALIRALEVRSIRTDSLDGTGLSVESEVIHPTCLTEYTARLARRLGYTGVGCAQFLIDVPTGEVSFLEINPRITGSHRCTDQLGMDLTRLAISLAGSFRETEAMTVFAYPSATRFCWTYGDLGGLRAALASGEIGPFEAVRWLGRALVSFCRADFHQTWDWDDPWPTLLVFAGKVPGLSWVMRRWLMGPQIGRKTLQVGRSSSVPSPIQAFKGTSTGSA